jgi:hypothetical protein
MNPHEQLKFIEKNEGCRKCRYSRIADEAGYYILCKYDDDLPWCKGPYLGPEPQRFSLVEFVKSLFGKFNKHNKHNKSNK